MREILFRGQRLDNGEWVEGFLARTTLGSTIIVNEVEEYSCGCCIGIGSANFEVDPSTVGQYTGLNDKNGKRIFEGDILGTRYYYLSPDNVAVEVVKWFCNSWVIQEGDRPPTMLEEDEILPYSEVLGNVHDNKELWGD